MLKQILAAAPVQALIGRSIGLYMHLVALTTRWRSVNRDVPEPFWAKAKPAILCGWHGRFILMHKTWAFGSGIPRARMLISQSREGGIVAHAARSVGADIVRGSAAKGAKPKGGFEAMREMLRHMALGGTISLTPDGPRGPRMRAKMGPIQLAKLSGVPLLPATWSTRWRIQFSSWDKLILPLPFGQGALVWGELIHVPRDADDAAMEAARLALEAELNRICAEADRLAGAPPTEPAAANAQEYASVAASETAVAAT